MRKLRYYSNPQNILANSILMKKSGISILEIDKNKLRMREISAKINNSDFNEFELDDFKVKLKNEFENSLIKAENNYKNATKHIRIVDVNIPVEYTKYADGAQIFVHSDTIKRFDTHTKPLKLETFIYKVINNKYISKYIIPTNEDHEQYSIDSYIDTNRVDPFWRATFEADAKTVNDIGKINKGSDFITELTLHPLSINPYYTTHENGIEIRHYGVMFVVTSFKLKSIDKRFVTKYYVDKIEGSQSFANIYTIENDDVSILLSKD